MYKLILSAIFLFLLTRTSAQEVTIGTQTWMAKNLDIARFQNGDIIPEARTQQEWLKAGKEGKPAWCYYKNDSSNAANYGRLYNWYAVSDKRNLAPKGWHVPSYDEIKVMGEYLGGLEVAGAKLKSTTGWEVNGSNSTGFSGLPGGERVSYDSFFYFGTNGYWWTATEHDTSDAEDFFLFYHDGEIYHYWENKLAGMAVRCIKDEVLPPRITDFMETFEVNYGTYFWSSIYGKVKSGSLIVDASNRNGYGYVKCAFPDKFYFKDDEDWTLEVDVKRLSGPNSDMWGLGIDKGEFLLNENSDQCSINLGGEATIGGWVKAKIKKGENKMKLVKRGEELQVFLNDKLLKSGKVGKWHSNALFFMVSEKSGSAASVVSYDNVKFQILDKK
jgi:uncharacterized protein (TIGR02145 family)